MCLRRNWGKPGTNSGVSGTFFADPPTSRRERKCLTLLWGDLFCGAQVEWSQMCKGLVSSNSFQYQLIAWMLKKGRRPDETWLEHRVRTLREARSVLQSTGLGRWSSGWLARVWRYAGHRPRCSQRPVPWSGGSDGRVSYTGMVGS